jgi:hypothetical protein
MAKTVTEAFGKLKENIEPTSIQKEVLSTRQQSVRNAVSTDLLTIDSFLTGSYSRSTMIAPLTQADIDIFVVLDPKYYSFDGYEKVLDKVKSSLKKTYPKTPEISRNGQAVTITFTDFKVDVVPAFNRNGGGYLIPDTVGHRWISTNPKSHNEHITAHNTAHCGNLVPLVKMIKAWNRTINSVFVSFYLELALVKVLNGVTISDFPSAVRYFFDKGRDVVRYKISDPANYGDMINPLSSINTVDEAVSRFETALTRARKAEEFAKNYKTADAIEEWRKIFGKYFPASN